MRNFDYADTYFELLTPEIVSILIQIHEFNVEQKFLVQTEGNPLTHLLETARIQSVQASARIAGLVGSDDRIKKIVLTKTMPRTTFSAFIHSVTGTDA